MTLHERIDTQRGRLTKTDRALVDTLLSSPEDAVHWSGDDLAGLAGSHPAAATRLAQKLGFEGYPHLREELRRERRDAQQPLRGAGDRMRAELEEHRTGTVLDTFLRAEVESLAAVAECVDQARLDEIADAIADADTVHVFARGNANVLTELVERRLRRFGVRVVVLDSDGRELAERLTALTERDLVLAFAFRRPPRLLTGLLAHAAAIGARSVLVTDTLHTLDPAPDVLVAARRSDRDGFSSLTVPMAVTNALVLTLAHRHSDRTLPALDRLDSLLRTFE